LFIQQTTVAFHSPHEIALYSLTILFQLSERLDQRLSIEVIDGSRVCGHSTARHQGLDFRVVRDRHNRLEQNQRQQHIVKPRTHDDICRGQLAQ